MTHPLFLQPHPPTARRHAAWALPVAMAALAASAAAAPPAGPCALVDPARVQSMLPGTLLPLFADAPGTLQPREVPGLPVPLRLDQCTSAMGSSGAIGFRLGLLTAPRELTAVEWAAVGRALDHAEPMQGVTCGTDSQATRQGGRLHTAGCGQTRGRHRVEIGFEHERAAALPKADAIRALLQQALSRL